MRAWLRLVRRLAEPLLPERDREFVLGDLEEMYGRWLRDGSRSHAGLRYLRGLIGSVVARRIGTRAAAGGSPNGGRAGAPRAGSWLERVKTDLAYALRQLRRTPVMTGVASASLAGAIAVAVSAFSLLNAVLFKPLALPDSERVYHVYTSDARGRDHPYGSNSYPDYLDVAGTGVFTGLTAAQWERVAAALPESTPRNEYLQFVTPNYFAVLGVPLLRGAGFGASGTEPELLITEAWWTRTLNRDPGVLGRAVRVNGQLLTIVGVVPSRFRGTGFGPPVMGWAPAALMPAVLGDTSALTTRFWRQFSLVGRLAPGQTEAGVSARLDALAGVLARQYPREWMDMNGEPRRLSLLTHRESLAPPGAREELVLAVGGVSALVLLILLLACTNVAGLLLSRAVSRQHELAVRLTLGATRRRLCAQLLTESLVLGLIGGGLGLLITQWAVQFARRFPGLDSFDLQPDWRVLSVALAFSLLSAALFGLTPALHSLRIDLRSGLAGKSGSAQRNRLRGGLIAGQVAVSCVLILLAIQAARGVRAHVRRDPGIALENLLVANLEVREFTLDGARIRAFVQQVHESAGAIPGVRSAATTTLLPLGNVHTRVPIHRPDGESFNTSWNTVSARFFETLGLAATEGRVFDSSDATSSRHVAVARTEFVRAWGAPVLGRTIEPANRPAVEIVGVVPDVPYRPQEERPEPLVYLLAEQDDANNVRATLVLRVQPGAEAEVAGELQRRIAEQYPDVVVPAVETMRAFLEKSALPQQIAARVALGIGAVELAMAAVGLYGLLLFAIIARTRELGIRLALGAGPARASMAVTQSGLRYAVAGAAAGLLLGAPALILASNRLLGARASDPLPYFGGVACVLAASCLAALVPLRRAARIQPAVALRHD